MGTEIYRAVMDARTEWEQRFGNTGHRWEHRSRRRTDLAALLISLIAWLF